MLAFEVLLQNVKQVAFVYAAATIQKACYLASEYQPEEIKRAVCRQESPRRKKFEKSF
jgi:hypothetical protein